MIGITGEDRGSRTEDGKSSSIVNSRSAPLLTSAALAALFLILYGSCNRLTALRSHIPSFYFPWERRIPFIPWLILPYMSIDLFFLAAPFLARSDRELRTIAQRIAFAILLSTVCFLLFPMRFAFDRPPVAGPLGVIFNNFRKLDLPFNQFPSLHIALLIVLADIYVRRFKSWPRAFIVVWFALIAISPLLTYQHHLIDILGGFFLGVLCLHLFDDEPIRGQLVPNLRIAGYYATAAALFIALSLRGWPRVLCLWPALSLAFVAVAYLYFGPAIYRKHNGRFRWTTPMLLWPALVGQRISLWHYARSSNAYDRITDRLWIGRQLTTREARALLSTGVTAILDLCCEFSEPKPLRDAYYLNLPILDLTAPTPHQIQTAVDFIQHHTRTGIVYVHCKAGYSRTAAIAGIYLLDCGLANTAEEAIARLRQARPSLIARPEVIATLRAYERVLCAAASQPAVNNLQLTVSE